MYSQGDVLLAWLFFTDGQASKRRPVLVVQDFGDDDLLVVPITSHPTRGDMDLLITDWKTAGLRLPSVIRVAKLATIEKTCVARKLGGLPQTALIQFKETLTVVCRRIQQ
jgi:mRNA interferase MazF